MGGGGGGAKEGMLLRILQLYWILHVPNTQKLLPKTRELKTNFEYFRNIFVIFVFVVTMYK